MSGTVMNFGPHWIRTLTDGAAPSSATNNQNNTNSTNSGSTTSSSSFSNNAPVNSNNTNSTTSSSSTLSSSATSNYYSNNNSTSLSTNNGSNTTNASKYKLAEYRYGREEMLALFDSAMEAPDDIKRFSELFIEKARDPVAMTQMSDEELKLSTRSWNSEAVLRSSGKMAAQAAAAAAAAGVAGVAGSNHVSGGISGTGGHSNIIDRDSRQLSERGALTAAEVLSSSPRGPPGSLSRMPLGEQRGLLSSLSSRGHPSTIRNLVSRSANMYMRSQSHDDEGIVSGDGVGGGPGSGGASGYDSRFGSSGQPRQPSSLRARFETSRAPGIPGLHSTTKPIDIKAEGAELPVGRSVFDRLPSKYNVDDKLIRKDINARPTQTDWRSREWLSAGQDDNRSPKGVGPPNEDRSWRSSRTSNAAAVDDWRSGSQRSSTGVAPPSSWYVRSDDQRNMRQLPQNQENLNPTFSGKRDTTRRPSADEKQGNEDDEPIHVQPRHRRDSLPEWSIGDPLSGDRVGSFDASGAFREISREEGHPSLNSSQQVKATEVKAQVQQPPAQQHLQQRQQQQQQHQQQQQLKRQQDQHPKDHSNSDFDLERAAEIMVEKWTAEEEQHDHRSSSSPEFLGKSNSNAREQHDAQQANILQNSSIDNRKVNHLQQRREPSNQPGPELHANVGSAGGSTGSSFESNNQQKLILLPINHEDSQQWFYRDTQGVIQGPFSANDMFEWYKAGYFVKELLVRRACDELFYPIGEVIKMWDRIPFAPLPSHMAPPPPITTQTIHQFRAMAKQLELAAAQGRIPSNAYDVTHPGAVLLHAPLLQQQQLHPVLAAASLGQNALNHPDQQANIRQIIEAATRQQQQQQQQQHSHQSIVQRSIPVSAPDQNEMQAQLRQLLVQLKNREGFSNLNAQEQQEVLVRQFVESRALPPTSASNNNSNPLQEQQDHQSLLQQQQRARMVPFMPAFLSNDQEERMRAQQELERRQKEEAEKQQSRLIMEQRLKVEEEKQRLMEEVQKQRQKKQLEESEKQKQEAEKERILKMSQLKQQQLAKQHEEFKQQMQNQQRIHQQQQQEKKQQQQTMQAQTLTVIQQQQQQQIERAKKAAQAHQVLQEQQQQQQQQQQQHQQRKTAWSTVSKPDQEPVSLATLQKLQEEEKEKERERQRQQQVQANQQQQQQQQQIHNFQRQMTWANAAQQSKVAPVKTLAEIQKEEEERLAREKQRKVKVQPTVASAGVWNNAASHLSWKNPPSDS